MHKDLANICSWSTLFLLWFFLSTDFSLNSRRYEWVVIYFMDDVFLCVLFIYLFYVCVLFLFYYFKFWNISFNKMCWLLLLLFMNDIFVSLFCTIRNLTVVVNLALLFIVKTQKRKIWNSNNTPFADFNVPCHTTNTPDLTVLKWFHSFYKTGAGFFKWKKFEI